MFNMFKTLSKVPAEALRKSPAEVDTVDHPVKVTRSVKSGIELLARSLPDLIRGLLKLNAVALFLWYLVSFAQVPWEIGKPANIMVGASGVIFFIFACGIFGYGARKEWKTPSQTFSHTNGWFYLLLVVAPIVAVGLIRLLYTSHQDFHSELLNGTETQIERLYANFR